MSRPSDWFVLVATDLFMAAFAAIIIIDIISPKYPKGEVGNATSSEFVYSISGDQSCTNFDHQTVAFKINDGTDSYTLFDLNSISAGRLSDKCVVTGKFEDIGVEVEQHCLLISGPMKQWPKAVELTISNGVSLQFSKDLSSTEGGQCA